MKPSKQYPFIAYETQRGKIEIVACSERRYRLIYDGKFVQAFSSLVYAVRYMNREFICRV